MRTGNHQWNFSIIGGVKRVNLDSGADLANLADLDPKLWTALSCPVADMAIDRRTLELIDDDNDGQIRVPDVIAAVNWILSVINNADDLLKQSEDFPLSAINVSTPQGKILRDSAETILRNLGKADEKVLSVADTSDTQKIFAGTRFNGDGVITIETAGTDDQISALIADIMQYAGSAPDRSGSAGITADIIASFFEQCEKYAAWQALKDAAPADILPLGDDTEAAYNTYLELKPKVDDFFLRCRLAAFDPQLSGSLNLQTSRIDSITDKDLSAQTGEIAAFPIANITTGSLLPLHKGINPAWEERLRTFVGLAAQRLFPGKEAISEADWNKVSQTFAAYAQWQAAKEGTMVAPLGLPRIKEWLGSDYRVRLTSLVEQDKAVEQEANNIILVDKLVRYYRDLYTLLKNFVTFYDFYSPGRKAIFQAGTLYIDQRSCDLCIKVKDINRQSELAPVSGMFLVYCDCVSKSTNERMTIIAALTNGDVDDLMVGRNALFFDRKGNDWDATIIKITENPISIRQAFFAPYKRLTKLIESQVNKAASAADEKAMDKMSKSVDEAADKADKAEAEAAKAAPAADQAEPFDVAKFAGIFAAVGLAMGAIGTFLAAAIGGFLKLVWWKMPLALIGLMITVSAPSMILAYIKLRKRSLAPILDANGWAINSKVKINIAFGRTLTHLAALPKGARIDFNDPFREKRNPLIPVFIGVVIVGAAVLYYMWKHKVGLWH